MREKKNDKSHNYEDQSLPPTGGRSIDLETSQVVALNGAGGTFQGLCNESPAALVMDFQLLGALSQSAKVILKSIGFFTSLAKYIVHHHDRKLVADDAEYHEAQNDGE